MPAKRKFGNHETKTARVPEHWDPLDIYEGIKNLKVAATDGLDSPDPYVQERCKKILSIISRIDA